MRARKRILILIPNMGGGGAQRVIATLLKHLDRSKFEPMLGVLDRSRDVFASHVPPDVPLLDLKAERVRYALPAALRLIWRTRPDVVMSTLDHLNLALAVTRPVWPRGVRCALRLTNTMSAEEWLNRLAMPLFLRFADVLIYQSQSMKEVFERALGIGAVPSRVLANPVDLQAVRRLAEEPAEDIGLDPDAFNLMAVGRLDTIKGFDIAIDAMDLVKDKTVTLTILGEGEQRADLTARIRARGLQDRIRVIGFKPNPYPLMRRANALLLCSRYEGFPNVVLEALGLGVPVIATPVAGVPELLTGVPGCAVASAIDAPALAAAIDYANANRGVPSESAVDAYDAANATLGYENVFLELAALPS